MHTNRRNMSLIIPVKAEFYTKSNELFNTMCAKTLKKAGVLSVCSNAADPEA